MSNFVGDEMLGHESNIVWLEDISEKPWVREYWVAFFSKKGISEEMFSKLQENEILMGFAELEDYVSPLYGEENRKYFYRRIFTLRKNDYETYKADDPLKGNYPKEAVDPLTVKPKLKSLPPTQKSQIAVRVPFVLLSKLKRYVQQTGISQTDVIVTALAKYLDSVEGIPMLQRIVELEKRVEALESKS